MYIRTVDACIVMHSEDRTYQEFTGRDYDLVNSK